jgi:hypothetical protein
MVAVLRRNFTTKKVHVKQRRNWRAYSYSVRDKRRWTDEQIRNQLGMTKQQFSRAILAYQQEVSQPRWDRERLAQKILDFAIKNERWPTSKELDEKWKDLNLPARSSIGRHFVSDWRAPAGSAYAQLVAYIVDDPKKWRQLTPALILSIRNVTVRRRAMEKYGIERLLKKGGGICVQQDDYGKLWRLPTDNPADDHAQWVEVVNSSPEEDGSFAHFFLRVPANVDTAKAAVAWTAQKNPQEFKIKVAT